MVHVDCPDIKWFALGSCFNLFYLDVLTLKKQALLYESIRFTFCHFAGKGLTLIAGKDPVRYEAQSDTIQIQAKQLVNIQSANSHIDWAAAKKISLSTADGANITIEGGNITVQCPGQLTVHAASKTFDGPTRLSYPLPGLPKHICKECLLSARASGSPFATA
jgi:type VI secretion system secreted protein VgrG